MTPLHVFLLLFQVKIIKNDFFSQFSLHPNVQVIAEFNVLAACLMQDFKEMRQTATAAATTVDR